MKRCLIVLGLLASVFILPAAARAATVYTTISINLWSGPSSYYPRVIRLPAGVPLVIYGCLGDWDWCDVDWRGYRGWVPATYLYSRYGGRHVYIREYGPRLGLGITFFDVNTYWDHHYRSRYDWYRERDRWSRPPQRPHPRQSQGDFQGSPRRSEAVRPEANRPGPGQSGRAGHRPERGEQRR